MARRLDRNQLAVPQTVSNGASVNVGNLSDLTYQIFAATGTFDSSEYMLQGTIDGAHWFDLLSGNLTAAGGNRITQAIKLIRVATKVAPVTPASNVVEVWIAGRLEAGE